MFLKRISSLIIVLLMMTGISLEGGLAAYAYIESPQGPGEVGKTQAELNSYTEEEWRKLMDNNLEYEEIGELIQNFNPVIVELWKNYDSAIENLEYDIGALKNAKRDMESLRDRAKEEKDLESYSLYYAQVAALTSIITGMNNATYSLNKKEGSKTAMLQKAKKQTVAVTETLFLTYHSMLTREEILNEMIRLNQSILSQSTALVNTGMGIGADITKAQTDLYSAQFQLSTLKSGKEEVRRALILLCGWSFDAEPVIGSVPPPDTGIVDVLDPSVDIIKAIGNNYTLIDSRNSSYKKSPGAKRARALTEQQLEDILRVKLDTLHADTKSKRIAYEAANVGYQSAEIAKNASETKKNLGMLSEAEYIAESLAYIQKKSALKTAELDLLLSVKIYKEAVNGLVSLEEE